MKERKIQVTPLEAAEWMADGYYVECFVLVSPTIPTEPAPIAPSVKTEEVIPSFVTQQYTRKSPVHIHKKVPKTAILALSLDGNEPKQGRLGHAWKKLKKNLFTKEATASYSRKQIEKAVSLVDESAVPSNYSSEFIHRYKCLRVIAPTYKGTNHEN